MGSNQSRCTPCNNQSQPQRSQPQPLNCSPRVSTAPLYNQYNNGRPLSNCQNIGQIGQSVPLAYKVAPVHYQPSRQMSYPTQTRQLTQQNCNQQQPCRYQTNMQPPVNMQPRKPSTCCYTPPPQHHQRSSQPRPYSCVSPVTTCSPQPSQPSQPSVNYSRQSIAFPQQFYYSSCTPPSHPSSYGYYNNNCTFTNSFGGCGGYPISSY